MQIDLSGQVAVVTGGLGGIGRAIAATLRRAGACVAAWDLYRDPKFDDERQWSVAVNVTEEASVTAATAATLERFSRIDILINGAGFVGKEGPMEALSLQEWNDIVSANLTSVFLCCRAVIPEMRQRGYGRIVNITSNAGKDSTPYQSAYSASKAAAIGLTKALGRELAESGVLVNCITPALIDTPLVLALTEESRKVALGKIPMRRMGKPEEVAALVTWLSSDQVSFSTGASYDLSGGRSP